MSDFSEWGYAESGPRTAQLDYDKQMSELMQNTHTAAQLPEIAARTKLYGAQARKETAEADEAERTAVAMAQAAQRLKVAPTGASNDPDYNPGYDLAKAMNDAGAFTAGQKVLKQAVDIDTSRANAKRYKAVADHEEALNLKMHAEKLGGMAQGAMKDQEAYNNFLMQAPALKYNIQGFPPDVESARPMLQTIANQGMTAGQMVTAELARQRLDDAKQARATTERLANKRIEALNTTMDYTRARKDDLVKNGGARAEAAIESTRELTRLRQQKEALENLKTAGKTPNNPAPIPLADGKPNAAKLVPGQYYLGGRGQVGKWDGKQLLLVTKPPKAVNVAPPAEVDDDEDD